MSLQSMISSSVLCTAFAVGNVASAQGESAPQSLYSRLGGKPVVEAVVSEVLDRVVADHKLGRSFAGSNIDRIKRLLAEQICSLAGGGCTYSGDSMHDVHAGQHISESEFYGLVEILRSSMQVHHVGLRERNELLALLAPMKRDVVESPAPSPRRGR